MASPPESGYTINRRQFLAAGAGAAIVWTSGALPPIPNDAFAATARSSPVAEAQHLGLAEARALMGNLLRAHEWLDRHLDLRAYRSTSLEVILFLSKVELLMWTVNFDILSPELLKAILLADTVHLNFGPRADLGVWAAMEPETVAKTIALVREFEMPQKMTVAVAEKVRRCGCTNIRLGEFNELDTDTAEALARFQWELIFDVAKAWDPQVARSLTVHEGEGIYIYSYARPAQCVVNEFRNTRRRSLCLEHETDKLGETGWRLAWEPARNFIAHQHGKRLRAIADSAKDDMA